MARKDISTSTMYAIVAMLFVVILAATFMPCYHKMASVREPFELSLPATSSKYYTNYINTSSMNKKLNEFDTTIRNMDINVANENLQFKRCYHFPGDVVANMNSINQDSTNPLAKLLSNNVAFYSFSVQTNSFDVDVYNNIIATNITNFKKAIGQSTIQGDVYVLLTQFPYYKKSGKDVAITSYGADQEMRSLKDVNGAYPSPSNNADMAIRYGIVLIFDKYEYTKSPLSLRKPPMMMVDKRNKGRVDFRQFKPIPSNRKTFSSTIMPALDAKNASAEYQCFLSVAGNPTLPGGCASLQTPEPTFGLYESTCYGPKKASYADNGPNQDLKTTISTYATLYRVSPLTVNPPQISGVPILS